jgi:hypothetical protein
MLLDPRLRHCLCDRLLPLDSAGTMSSRPWGRVQCRHDGQAVSHVNRITSHPGPLPPGVAHKDLDVPPCLPLNHFFKFQSRAAKPVYLREGPLCVQSRHLKMCPHSSATNVNSATHISYKRVWSRVRCGHAPTGYATDGRGATAALYSPDKYLPVSGTHFC